MEQPQLYQGFIDQNKTVTAQFQPKLLTNKHHETVIHNTSRIKNIPY